MKIDSWRVVMVYPPCIHVDEDYSSKIDGVLDIGGVKEIDYFHDVHITIEFDHQPKMKELQQIDSQIKKALGLDVVRKS